MQKVLFDLSIYQRGTDFHGGGEYGYTVFNELLKKKQEERIDVFMHPNKSVASEIITLCNKNGVLIQYCKNKQDLEQLIERERYNLVYTALAQPEYFQNIQLKPEVRFMYTLHGLRKVELVDGDKYEYFFDEVIKTRHKVKNWIKKKIAYEKVLEERKKFYKDFMDITINKKIITVSYHSKYSILRYFPSIKENEIEVLYSPLKLQKAVWDEIGEKRVLDTLEIGKKNYGLLISADRWGKNCIRGMQAYDRLFSDKNTTIPSNFKVVVLGAKNQEKLYKLIQNRDKFIIRGYVDEIELEMLYKNAQLFLYPTLNEGFGYPPLEAMKYGTPSACSVNTSVPEVCGDAVLYFNPLSVEEIAIRILQSFDKEIMERKKPEMQKRLQYISEKQDKDLERIVALILGS